MKIKKRKIRQQDIYTPPTYLKQQEGPHLTVRAFLLFCRPIYIDWRWYYETIISCISLPLRDHFQMALRTPADNSRQVCTANGTNVNHLSIYIISPEL